MPCEGFLDQRLGGVRSRFRYGILANRGLASPIRSAVLLSNMCARNDVGYLAPLVTGTVSVA